jgi:hypothetical protein
MIYVSYDEKETNTQASYKTTVHVQYFTTYHARMRLFNTMLLLDENGPQFDINSITCSYHRCTE